jgi:glycosyltransferase involved in cell wall biosynthesis
MRRPHPSERRNGDGVRLRIGLIATVESPVRQTGSGSIETLVWLLSRDLSRLGHDVTVFAVAGSDPCGALVPTVPNPLTRAAPIDWQLREWINLCRAVEDSERFDVLHSHVHLWSLPLQALARAPMVHTYHLWPSESEAYLWSRVPNARVVAVSKCQWTQYAELLTPTATIHHGVDASLFTLRSHPDDYVCFVGQFTWNKGVTVAIEAARALGLRLLLAGPANQYYDEQVAPLVDGSAVEYVGYVTGSERDKLLGGARALLYPIQSPEPFGLVQVEAMMCGTPVAAIRLGAVPEIVDEGITGVTAATTSEFQHAVLQALTLDRQRVRERAEARFSPERMAREYVAVYEQACREAEVRSA